MRSRTDFSGHLHVRETTFVYVSRAPLEKIEAYKASKGWTFPWYSSYGSDFNYDFHATLDESVAPVEYNFQTIDDQDEQSTEVPGRSSFLREEIASSTPTPSMPVAWRRSVVLTTSWTRRRSDGRRNRTQGSRGGRAWQRPRLLIIART